MNFIISILLIISGVLAWIYYGKSEVSIVLPLTVNATQLVWNYILFFYLK